MPIELPRYALHLTGAGAWERIQSHGLLTADDAVRGAEINGEPVDVDRFVTRRRADPVLVRHAERGDVVLNHNRPIYPTVLDACLANAATNGVTESTAEDFYRALNRRVFFWPRREFGSVGSHNSDVFSRAVSAIGRELKTSPGVDRLWFDLHALSNNVDTRLGLARYNSGSTPRFVHQVERYRIYRSAAMWIPLADWREGARHVKELAIVGSLTYRHVVTTVARVERINERGALRVIHTGE